MPHPTSAEPLLRLAIEAAPTGILMVDRAGRVLFANAKVAALFGYEREGLVGRSVDQLVPERLRGAHAGLREAFVADAHEARPMGAGRDLYGLRRDGSEVPIEIGLSPMTVDDGQVIVIATVVDITERKRTAERLERSLREKETLLREVHHRVKNNLQVISSLLALQSRYVDQPSAASVLAEANGRVHSIALAHETLYHEGNFSEFAFGTYLRVLVSQLASTWGQSVARTCIEADPALEVPSDVAVPCGLIVNELVTNAFKHAFAGRADPGTVTVSARSSADDLVLEIADDGVGLPPGGPAPSRMGLRLVETLARQLSARLEHPPRAVGLAVRLLVPVHR
ncbi:MAG: histidine kinase dimerization/phosphoacceptor domain -containing protein [Myxococcota bacterium]